MIKADIIHNAVDIKYLENDKSIELLSLLSINLSLINVLHTLFSPLDFLLKRACETIHYYPLFVHTHHKSSKITVKMILNIAS